MEKVSVFIHRLDFALRLMDTTTGRNLPGRLARVCIDGKLAPCGVKEDGILVFQGIGKERFRVDVSIPGYEAETLEAEPAGLDGRLLELSMLPTPGYGTALLTLEGTLPGIAELTAVRAGDNACLMREFDPKKKRVTFFNPHHLEMGRVHYALVDPDREVYEPFRIVKAIDDKTLQVDRVLKTAFKNYYPISPLVFGRTDGGGAYRLRVRDDAKDAKWLFRCVADGQPKYRTVDFRQTETPDWRDG